MRVPPALWAGALLALEACGSPASPEMDRTPAGKHGQPDAGLPAPDVDLILRAGCATSTEQRSLLPSNILFVVDRSQSMTCNPPPETDSERCEMAPVRSNLVAPSKWEIIRSALIGAVGQLPADVRVGLSYFSNDDSCGVHPLPSVELAPLSPTQLEAIEASLRSVEPAGGTPVVGATILAYQHLHAQALAGVLRGNKYVVLLTDGEQSDECIDDQRCDSAAACTELLVDEEVPKASGEGVNIRTFVIGAPGSEPARTVLSRIAVAGETANPGCDPNDGDCHFDMTRGGDFDAALATALRRIGGAATPCELTLPTPGKGVDVDPDFLNVIYSPGDGSEPRLVAQLDAQGCDEGEAGWRYGDAGDRINLCGETCAAVRADPSGRVDVVLGCRTEGPQ